MFNDYSPEYIKKCPFPGIPAYLDIQPKGTIGIPSARIIHVYCDNRADPEDDARGSLIPNVVDKPEDMIGQVDAVIVATDKGLENVERCRPFIELGKSHSPLRHSGACENGYWRHRQP